MQNISYLDNFFNPNNRLLLDYYWRAVNRKLYLKLI